MIVTKLHFNRCSFCGGKRISRIVKPGRLIEGAEGVLLFDGFEIEITAMPWDTKAFANLEIEQLGIDYAREQGHYVELDKGGEKHGEDDDDGDAWKKG